MSTAALVALAIVVSASLRSRSAVTNAWVARLRVLVPAWRFFDRPTAAPELFVRAAGGEWRAVAPPARGAFAWAFAPRANVALAEHAAVEHLVAEVAELDTSVDHDAPEIVGLVSYALVARVAAEHAPAGARWQWKIQVEREDYLVSPELAA